MGEVIRMKPKAYYFDINKKFDDVINSVQFDKNSRFIEVNFLSNSQAVNLTGYRATIRAIKPDKTEVFDELKEIDASVGKYELELTEQLNAVAGDVLAQFEIYGEGESLFTTSQFKIGVSKSLSREKTTSSDELGVLVNVMAEAQQYKNNFVKIDAKIDDEIAKTNAQLSQNDAKINFLEKMKLKHVYRAKALGGDVDNHIAIANAIKNDKCVYFPAGEYEIEDEILIENIDGIVITGDSDVRLVKRETTKKLFIFKYCKDVTFSSIHFYENNNNITSPIENSQAINFSIGCTGLKVNACTFKNFADCCIVDRTQSVNEDDYELTTSVKNSKSIISSCLFENCIHTYLTKSGGGKNIIYSGNIHTNCIAGIKIDGEVYNVDGTSTTYEDFAGNAVINGNIFYKSKAVEWNAYSCIEVEEKSKNTLITSNLFIENETPSIHLKFGQSSADVKDILISTNQFTNNNEFDIVIRGEGVALYKNINVVNNDFSNCRKNMIYLVTPNLGTLNGLNISSNRFYSEIGAIYSFIQLNGGEHLKNILLKNNDFIAEDTRRFLAVENLGVDSDEDFIIRDNTFKNRGGSSDAVELINTIALVANNKFIKCDLKLCASEVLIQDNTFNNSIINTIHSDIANNLLLFENKFKKGDRIGNYMVAIRDGGNHEGFNNVFIGELVNPIYTQNGLYTTKEYVIK